MFLDAFAQLLSHRIFLYLCTRKGINSLLIVDLYLITYNILFFNGFIPESV